jgi:hypothetical protein
MTGHSDSQFIDVLGQFVAVPFNSDTYKRLLYLLLACPLVLVYVIGTTVGFSLGIGLAVTVIGLPILLVTLLAVTSAAQLEAYLSRICLGRESSPPRALMGLRMDLDDSDVGYLRALKRFMADPSTWTSLGLVAVKSVFGLVAFVVLVTVTTVVATLVAAPVLYDNPEFVYQVATYSVDTLSEAVGLAAVGGVLGLVALHLLNAFADLGGYLTESLLTVGTPSEE